MDSQSKLNWMAAVSLVFAFVAILYVTKAFITTILLSTFFAYILIPIYSRLVKITGRKRLSSILSISLVFVIFIIFVLNVINALSVEASTLSLSQEQINQTTASYISQKTDDVFEIANGFVEEHVPEMASPYAKQLIEEVKVRASPILEAPANTLIPEVLPRLISVVSGIATGIATNLPILLAQVGVAILLTYYLLVDGGKAINNALFLMPERRIVHKFLKELNSIYNSLFNVYLITSLITGILAAIGFTLLEISYPLLWGMVTAVFAFIPLIGSTTIFAPMALYYLVMQDYTRGLALLAYGLIFLNLVPENLIRPRLALRGASIHPAITLLAFAAPLFVVGMKGIIIGPVLYGFVLAAYRTKRSLQEEWTEEGAEEGSESHMPEDWTVSIRNDRTTPSKGSAAGSPIGPHSTGPTPSSSSPSTADSSSRSRRNRLGAQMKSIIKKVTRGRL